MKCRLFGLYLAPCLVCDIFCGKKLHIFQWGVPFDLLHIHLTFKWIKLKILVSSFTNATALKLSKSIETLSTRQHKQFPGTTLNKKVLEFIMVCFMWLKSYSFIFLREKIKIKYFSSNLFQTFSCDNIARRSVLCELLSLLFLYLRSY